MKHKASLTTMEPNYQDDFLIEADKSFRTLFSRAQQSDELQFVLSLIPESRPYAINTFAESQSAVNEYLDYLADGMKSRISVRVALALYSHISESSALWEIPMNMMNILNGDRYSVIPFSERVKNLGDKENSIAPNANQIMRYLIKCAQKTGIEQLALAFKNAFDPDLRNGFSHADYVIMADGICVGPRYKRERIITWDEFLGLLNRAINFRVTLEQVHKEYLESYSTLKTLTGRINNIQPEGTYDVYYRDGALTIRGGIGHGQLPKV
jgi:hypothetical protein